MKKYLLIFIFSAFYFVCFSQNAEPIKSDQAEFKSLKVESELKVYPNPSKSNKVTVESNQNDLSEIGITNLAGKQIFKKNYQFPESKSEIELTDVPNGIYLIKIKTDDNRVVAKKLIVAKE